MAERRIVTVDVFAERQYAGNQLAVVLDADDLSTEQMQCIALEMNYSETTFVVSQSATSARVRIFTPDAELPFAGHPTIGTAWVLGRQFPGYTLELDAGDVPVEFDSDTGICWMQPPVARLGEQIDPIIAAELINLSPEDLHDSLPCQIVDIGPVFLLIGVRNLDALKRVALNLTALRDYEATKGHHVGVFIYCEGGYTPDAGYAARMLFESAGLREDPATGSANAGFAYYLIEHLKRPFETLVQQGYEINRPSSVYLKAERLKAERLKAERLKAENSLKADDSVKVGGRVFKVLEGMLT